MGKTTGTMPGTRVAGRAGWLAAIASMILGLAWMVLDAEDRRNEHATRLANREAVVRLTGTADLFLSSSSRWIRHLSLTEPGAAFADGPAILDGDPGGGFAGPAGTLKGEDPHRGPVAGSENTP